MKFECEQTRCAKGVSHALASYKSRASHVWMEQRSNYKYCRVRIPVLYCTRSSEKVRKRGGETSHSVIKKIRGYCVDINGFCKGRSSFDFIGPQVVDSQFLFRCFPNTPVGGRVLPLCPGLLSVTTVWLVNQFVNYQFLFRCFFQHTSGRAGITIILPLPRQWYYSEHLKYTEPQVQVSHQSQKPPNILQQWQCN